MNENYLLWKLKSRLNYLEAENPVICKVFDDTGKWVAFTDEMYLLDKLDNDYKICFCDYRGEMKA